MSATGGERTYDWYENQDFQDKQSSGLILQEWKIVGNNLRSARFTVMESYTSPPSD
jgi:hypothetical protein